MTTDITRTLYDIKLVFIAQTIMVMVAILFTMITIPIMIRAIQNRRFVQQINIALLLIVVPYTLCIVGAKQGKQERIDIDGELIISKSTAFSLIGRPNLIKNKQIFHQAYNLTKILDLFDRIAHLGILVTNQCHDYVEKIGTNYKSSSRPKRESSTFGKYEFRQRSPVDIYEAQLRCERIGKKLPEPQTDYELESINTLLKRYSVTKVAVGLIFDHATYSWRYKHTGHIPQDSWFTKNKTWTAEDGKAPTLEAPLQWRIDDQNANLFVETPGILVFRSIGSTKYDNHYLDNKNIDRYYMDKRTPVICESNAQATGDIKGSDPDEQGRLQSEWARTIDLCEATAAHINQSSIILMDQFARIVNQAGLYFEQPMTVGPYLRKKLNWDSPLKKKDKRFLLATLGKALSFVPGLAIDLFRGFIFDRKAKRMEGSIEEIMAAVKKHSTQLQAIEVQLLDVQILTQALTQMVQKLYHIVSSLRDMHAVTQTITAIMIHHQEIILHAQDSLAQLNTVLESLMNQKVPISMTGNIRKFLSIKGENDLTYMLSPERPIGVDPIVKNDLIHVYTVFLEGGPKFDLYQVTPLPHFEGGIAVTRKIPYEFILIDGGQKMFTPLTKEDLPFCLTGVCPVRHVLRKVKDDKCGVIALKDDAPFHDDCPAEFSPGDPVFVPTVHGIVYSVPTKITGQLHCPGKLDKAGNEGEYILQGTGVVTVPDGCDLHINDPELTLQGSVNEVFRSIADLDVIQSSFDGTYWSARAIDLSRNLTQHTQNWIATTVKERAWYFYLLITLVSLAGLVILSLIALKLVVVAKSYQKWKNVFKQFKDAVWGEALRARHLAESIWRFLDPLGQRQVAVQYMQTKTPDIPHLASSDDEDCQEMVKKEDH